MSDTTTSGRTPPPRVDMMRTMLGRARGLGAAKSGTGAWFVERLTALALVPLSVWFVLAIFRLVGAPRAEVAHWAGHPVNATLLLALVAATFQHMQLGLQVVIEDYIPGNRSRLLV